MTTPLRELTARRPGTTTDAKPKRYQPRPILDPEQRHTRSSRCPECGGKVIMPCYACWLARHKARGGQFDPLDQHPCGIRPNGIPRVWSPEKVKDVWLMAAGGHTAAAISMLCHVEQSLATHVRNKILEHIQGYA